MNSFNENANLVPDFVSMTISQLAAFITQRDFATMERGEDVRNDNLRMIAMEYLIAKNENPDHIDDMERLIPEIGGDIRSTLQDLIAIYKNLPISLLEVKLKELIDNYNSADLNPFERSVLQQLIDVLKFSISNNVYVKQKAALQDGVHNYGSDLNYLEESFIEYKDKMMRLCDSLSNIYTKMSEAELIDHIKSLKESLKAKIKIVKDEIISKEFLNFANQIYANLYGRDSGIWW